MRELVIIFVAGYASTFLLGFQSRNVNSGHYKWAAGTSFCIALAQAFLWSRITRPDAGLAEALAYGASGASAITTAMYVHRRLILKERG